MLLSKAIKVLHSALVTILYFAFFGPVGSGWQVGGCTLMPNLVVGLSWLYNLVDVIPQKAFMVTHPLINVENYRVLVDKTTCTKIDVV
jgi:hypothetical protein